MVFLLLLATFGVLTTKSSGFQTYLIQQYLKSLAKKLNTTITVKSVGVSFFTGVTLHDLYVEDLHNDTLAYIHSLNVDVKEFSIEKKKIIVDEVNLEDAFFNLRKYKQDTTVNLSFIINHFKSNDTTSTNEWEFGLNSINIHDGRFNFNDDDEPHALAGVDYSHIEIKKFNLEANEIEFIPTGVNCNIDALSLIEKSGFELHDLKTEFNISEKGIITQHLEIKTEYSHVKGNVTFVMNTYADWVNFVEDVNIRSYFEDTQVNFLDICYFAPSFQCLNKSTSVQGEIKGRISNLKGRKLSLVFDEGTSFKGNLNISGLPDVENTFMHLNVDRLITSQEKIAELPIFPFCEKKTLQLPSSFKQLGTIYFKGNLTGFYYDFVAYGKFNTSIGSLTTDVSLKTIDEKIRYRGKIKSNRFHLGKFFEIPNELGEITMNVNIDGEGVNLDELEATMEGKIDQVEIKGYEYEHADVNGSFAHKIFNGYLAVKDKNIDFDFNGFVDISHELPVYNFTSNINYARLEELNLIEKLNMSTIFSTQLVVDIEGNHVDNIVGKAIVKDVKYVDREDSIYVTDITFNSQINGDQKKISIHSEILNGEIEGKYYFKELIEASSNNLVKYIPSLKNEDLKQVELSNDFKFDVTVLNTELVSKLLLGGIELGENSRLKGLYNSDLQSLSLEGKFPTINAHGIKINELEVQGNTSQKTLHLDVFASKIYQNDSIYIDNFNTNSIVRNDSLLTHVKWLNRDTTSRTEAGININTHFKGLNNFSSKFYDSYVYIDDTLWTVNENNLIDYTKQNDSLQLSIKSLGFNAANQSILIDGKLSGEEGDQVDIAMDKFNLFVLQKFIPKNLITVMGVVDGVASIKKENNEFIYTSDLEFSKLNINDNSIGSGEVKSIWSTIEKKLHVDGQFYKGHIPSIIFNGNYYPFKEEEYMDFYLKLQRTDLQMLNNYVSDYVSDLKGIASAEITVEGSPSKPSVNGYIQLQNTRFDVNYLQTGFSTPACKINIAPDMISFDNVLFFDATGKNKSVVNGTIFHEWYTNYSIDIGMDAHDFLALNTTEKDNNLYYGKAFLSGLINIGGYGEHLSIDLDVKTEKGTIINIPLDNNEEILENNFIEFVTKDTVEVEVPEEVDLSNILMNFDLQATPDAVVRLVFDDQIGDVMKATGSGDLNFAINQQGDFNIYGDYRVKDGDYLFTLQNIINKRFDLEEGGRIVWNGDPYDAQLNLTAVYRLRARLYELLATTEDSASAAVYKKRTPVNLKLIMTKSMLNPDIAFDIDLPTADETTKSKVRSILYVSNEQENIQELNKQVFSLLVLNQFIPPDGQEGGTYGNVGATTSSELLSNQLSNWLSKISNDFDIGINYRPGDELSSQELELALSTQIFNDRLILDGNFGVSDNKGVNADSQNSNNLIGDFSMEYKITQDGKLRVKAFNSSNQSYIERTSSNYTQGIGLFYRKEFDKFSDLFKKGLKKKSGNK